MDEAKVELETARIKSIIATAKHEGANEAIKEIMDYMLNGPLNAERIFRFMFEVNSRFNAVATENRNKYDELKGEFYGR